MNNRFALMLSVVLCGLFLVGTARADNFLKIDSILGESADARHKDEIVVSSFAFGAAASSSFTTAGASVGKTQFEALTFTHKLDRSSGPLLLALARGQMLKTAVLTARVAGTTNEYLKVTLTDVLVSSVKAAGDGNEAAQEEVTLRFAKVTFEYFQVQRDGTLAAGVKTSWDVVANKAF